MRIAITGSSGLIGSALKKHLSKKYEVIEISRSNNAWNPAKNEYNKELFKGLDAVVNLAGAGIADKRWSEQRKKELISSRVNSTKFLVGILKNNPPKVLISASGIGYYGVDDKQEFIEEDKQGNTFLAKLSDSWEKEANKLNTRVANIRIGMVLSKKGGALKKMLLPFSLGLGGKVGSGNQYISWVSIEDCVNAIEFLITNPKAQGPVNLCSENPVTNKEFSLALAKSLKRPCIFPLPEFIAKLIFGEMGEELLLGSTRAIPKKLLDLGFNFKHKKIEEAFKEII